MLARLRQALETDSQQPAVWSELAAAMHRLGRPVEERSALTRWLLIEPRNLHALLASAQLHERQGEAGAAAATYRTAVQSVPRGMNLTPGLRAAIDRGLRLVEDSNRRLERHLESRLDPVRARHAGEDLSRVEKSVATLLQKQPVYRPRPTFMYVPGLPEVEFFSREDFPWLDTIEAATADIRAEMLAVLAGDEGELEPYVQQPPNDVWGELNHSRRWSVYYLWKAGAPVQEHLRRCPKTAAALEAWPRCELPGSGPSALFSILDAKTRIPPHTGVNNARLICHLPLVVPPDCWFRVGAERREWREGEAFVFDDTFEHEAWNGSNVPRAVLIFDIWNPFVSPAEREMVQALTTGVADFYGELPAYI